MLHDLVGKFILAESEAFFGLKVKLPGPVGIMVTPLLCIVVRCNLWFKSMDECELVCEVFGNYFHVVGLGSTRMIKGGDYWVKCLAPVQCMVWRKDRDLYL